VRRYLRSVVGFALSGGDTVDDAEQKFTQIAAQWCARTGVDRRTLLVLGVSGRTLDAAGVRQVASNDLLRRYWPDGVFSVAELARRSGVSEATARQAMIRDEEAGLIRRAGREGRAVLWERTG